MITPAADDDQSRASSGRLSSVGTPGDNDTLSMDEVVRELRQALAGHIVRQVDESESDIQRSLVELQKRLSDIKAVYAESVGVVTNLKNRQLGSKEELESRVKSLEDASEEFSMIEDLEKRIKSAQNRIEEYKQRMASVGELIDRQERENQVRKRRTFYTTWSTVLSFVVLIISLIIARNKYHAHHGRAMVVEDSAAIGLDDILRELDQLPSQPVVSVSL
jgi:predicted RNase H-like nuclease (RuvC/YqgF family)